MESIMEPCRDCQLPCVEGVCDECLRLADEVECDAKYCREEHGGPEYCGCAESSEAALAYELRKVSPLVEAVLAYAEGA